METVQGIFQGFAQGFGFVKVSETEELYIAREHVNGALPKDRVVCHILQEAQEERKAEAEVIHVLQHGLLRLPGNCIAQDLVMADDAAIQELIAIVPPEKGEEIAGQKGHKVIIRIVRWPEEGGLQGVIEEDLGDAYAPTARIRGILCMHDLPVDFPPEVLAETEPLSDQIEIPEEERRWREDLREVPMVTIDGEDAKDLDDAITLTVNERGYQLGVHIADVSHYVTENSVLDKEAYKRGTSVYLVDRVIPMLPHKLSNGICSLNQGCDRLALSCIMDIDNKGNVVGHRICETLINVNRRMTYTNVKKILVDKEASVIEEYKELIPMFERMGELAAILRKKRFQRGSIDFDFPETNIILDKDGHPLEVKPYDRNVAPKIIEEFMLIANETVAEDYFWQEIPFLYRSHENPDMEKIQKLSTFINNFGYSIHTGDEIHPKELQKLLEKIDGTDEENLIARLTLRSMKRAQYTTECVGHFGLAAKYYCHFTSPIRRYPAAKYYTHFTSPIRRYPDLQIHRIIKENLHGGLKQTRFKHYQNLLPEVVKHTSTTERRADDAERDTDKVKMVEYMEKHMGEEFDGVISGMTAWGMYVELPSTIEGMVSVTSLRDGYYIYDENHYEMVNETTGRTFKLGQKVTVKVVATNKILRTIDFELSEGEWENGRTKKRKPTDFQ